jgi:hypothetical protein
MPQECVLGAKGPDRDIASARDAHHIAVVVDGSGGSIRIAREIGKLVYLAASRAIDHRLKLKKLILLLITGRITIGGLCPACYLAAVIGSAAKPL